MRRAVRRPESYSLAGPLSAFPPQWALKGRNTILLPLVQQSGDMAPPIMSPTSVGRRFRPLSSPTETDRQIASPDRRGLLLAGAAAVGAGLASKASASAAAARA